MTSGGNLDLVIDSLDEPFLLVDDQRIITRVNAAARDTLGEDLLGQPFVRSIRHPEAIRCLSEVLNGQASASAEIQLLTPHVTTFRLTAIALTGDNPAAVVLKDVSPLLAAAQMRSDFVANVSHELRSPLTTLAGLIETLKGPAKDDAEGRERFLNIMEREAGRMDRLIADLLSLSRVEEHEKVRPTETVDLCSIIKSVITNVQESGGEHDHEIEFQSDVDEARTPADPDQLTQVFQNLLENAIKYSAPGGKISISVLPQMNAPGFSGPLWVASVTDQGEGIDAEHIPRLTERFYRVDSGRSREMGGTGLGLAIVKHIVSRHRGRLGIKSTKGSGTEISVMLPAMT